MVNWQILCFYLRSISQSPISTKVLMDCKHHGSTSTKSTCNHRPLYGEDVCLQLPQAAALLASKRAAEESSIFSVHGVNSSQMPALSPWAHTHMTPRCKAGDGVHLTEERSTPMPAVKCWILVREGLCSFP